jgi:hypothetical protein
VTALAGLAGLLLAASPCAGGEASPAPVTRVVIEVFAVGLAGGGGEGLVFARREGSLEKGANPDGRARDLAEKAAGEIVLIHSTSWRWETDGRIVLTYLAWGKEGSLVSGARAVPRFAPPGPTDPLHPRPAEIRELDPLAHGLRHLAFLLRTSRDGAVGTAIGPRAAAALERIEPDVAGELPAR